MTPLTGIVDTRPFAEVDDTPEKAEDPGLDVKAATSLRRRGFSSMQMTTALAAGVTSHELAEGDWRNVAPRKPRKSDSKARAKAKAQRKARAKNRKR